MSKAERVLAEILIFKKKNLLRTDEACCNSRADSDGFCRGGSPVALGEAHAEECPGSLKTGLNHTKKEPRHAIRTAWRDKQGVSPSRHSN